MAKAVYDNPPITEALVELRFAPSEDWDWTIAGLVYGELRARYPHRKEVKSLEVELAGEKGEVTLKQGQSGISAIRLFSEDRTRLVQVGPHLLAVNKLKPYLGWDDFKPHVLDALQVYNSVAGVQRIQRIGVRYINQIGLPREKIELKDYFNVYPKLPTNDTIITFHLTTTLNYGENAFLNLILRGDSKTYPDIIFDLDFVYNDKNGIRPEDVSDHIDDAHEKTVSMFEACITDKLRETLGVRSSGTS